MQLTFQHPARDTNWHKVLCVPGTPLVYVRSPKCASTYYYGLLKANGWKDIKFNDIDWEQHHVFSFITEPYVRHVKGLVQDIVGAGIEKILLNWHGASFWEDLPWLGGHSQPLTFTFGDKFDLIDWIPIDGDKTSETILTGLLNQYQIELDWSHKISNTESDDYRKSVFKQIMMLGGPKKRDYFYTYNNDLEIYNKACLNHGVVSKTPR